MVCSQSHHIYICSYFLAPSLNLTFLTFIDRLLIGSPKMDRRLHAAVLVGNVPTFLELVRENVEILEQTTLRSMNTVMHLASKFGHLELVTELIKLRPEMVSAENEKMETPLHDACRRGHVEIVKLLVDADSWALSKLNSENESVLFVACEAGKFDVVKQLLDYTWLLTLEEDGLTTSLHVASSGGHLDIAKDLLEVRPDFAQRRDGHGCSPLHLACSKGHLDITRELLKLDPDLSASQDNEGRTPLHWAAIKGKVNILDEILSTSLQSAEMVTKLGETALHVAVKNNQYDAIKYLVDSLNVTNLVNIPDIDGNTILHLATASKLTTMVIFLLKNTSVAVNALNRRGFTPLDVAESDVSNSGALLLIPTLQEAGGKNSSQLPPESPEIQRIVASERVNKYNISEHSWWSKKNHDPPSNLQRQRRHSRREKQHELHNEGLRNARNTITVVAVLIAAVTFAAGINPPGGIYQDGSLVGKAIMGRTTPFKVFMVCNNLALFLSLCIVIVLVSVIPFRRKPLMKLLFLTHKVMWASISFMAAAYMAGTWVITRHVQGTRWMLVCLVSIGGGCLLSLAVGLGVMLARHWLRKWEWKKEKLQKDTPKSSVSRVEDELRAIRKKRESSNSDLESSEREGIHPY
ncbi:hypothetical protein IFM89_003780 [Coptis chinensis]|uniref:PGG domain-containing protein n=1 Tax=Coptis chinensis TaxID=261450 RepID=A0A835I556_9MAGN|nr:hypothetical protein IFM89_003780 [Coptis chinensis]